MKIIDYSKYPGREIRQPRSAFTAKLTKICQRLDATPVRSLTWNSELDICGIDPQRNATVQARSLWVVGSYARGSAHCGDLDLVFDFVCNKYPPRASVLNQQFLGAMSAVSVHTGSPHENSSGAVFAEAVLIWEPGMDWSAAIASIEVRAEAGRFARDMDAIPVRREQLGAMTFDAAEALLRKQRDGEVQWKFVPLADVTPVFEPVGEDEEHVARILSAQSATKRQLVPALLGYARQLRQERDIKVDVCLDHSDRSSMRLGGVRFHIERVNFDGSELDELGTSCIVFVPKLNVRGPNGFWTIERGPNHPLTRAFATTSLWVLGSEAGEAAPGLYATNDMYQFIKGVDVFATREAAEADALSWREAAPDEEPMYPLQLHGGRLLELLASVDVALNWDEGLALPLNWDGQRYAQSSDKMVTDVDSFFEKMTAAQVDPSVQVA